MTLLSIDQLCAAIDGQPILKGLSLAIQPGQVHAIMGPNGSGKSTLSNVLANRPGYQVTGGSVTFAQNDLLAMDTEERARAGLFLAFQYPVEIPGVSNLEFLKIALESVRSHQGLPAWDTATLMKAARQACDAVNLPQEFLKRGVNEGFSGGEKKRNEIMQLMLLQPKLAILDETDSGLDIDALKVVAQGVNAARSPQRSFVIITHYQRLLEFIQPDHVHILADGKIVKSGGPELAQTLEQKGYGWLESSTQAQPS